MSSNHKKLQRDVDLVMYVRRDDIHRRVRGAIRALLARVGFYHSVSPDLVYSAILTGFYYALMTRFSEENSLTWEWWTEERRQRGHHAMDRRYDYKILLENFPEFVDYYPDDPLTEDEVIYASVLEGERMIRGRGTALREAKYGKPVPIDGIACPKYNPSDYRPSDEDSSHPFGPVITRALEIALEEFGKAGLYWVVMRTIARGSATETYRLLGIPEEDLGHTSWQSIRRQIARKVKDMDPIMYARIQKDPIIQEYICH